MRIRKYIWAGPLLAALALGASGCVRTDDPDVNVAETPNDDAQYSQALSKATREQIVYKDFETRYRVTATYLSPGFRAAFGQRLEKVFKQGAAQFEEARTKAGFFVSILCPDNDDRADLGNPSHWTILLNGKDGALKPVLVKKLTDKERWRAFFRLDPWTVEYLILFDAPSVDANSPALVDKTNVSLMFANPDAQVNLNW